MRTGLAIPATRLMLAVALGGPVCGAAAHDLTMRECIEGGEFIKHAAMSRDNGVPRETFLERLAGDLILINQYPPHLRWFVQDRDDEALLVEAARMVFDAPRDPLSHQSDFLVRCAPAMGPRTDFRRGLPHCCSGGTALENLAQSRRARIAHANREKVVQS